MSKKIAVIDYGMGNLHSVASALAKVAPDVDVTVTDDADTITHADSVIFPGVGAIRDCMAEIKRRHIDEVVREVAQNKPLLGICVGMQALLSRSEENDGVECLDIIAGDVKRFGGDAEVFIDDDGERLKVPHMGWNKIEQSIDHPVWKNIDNGVRCYFVHSFYVAPQDESIVSARCHYGHDFAASLAKDNIFAVQFHPEKSADVGMQLLNNFVHWDGQF